MKHLIIPCALALGAQLLANPVPAQSAVRTKPTAVSANPVTRADLAAAYLRLDRAYAAATLSDSARSAINRMFDRSTLSFFAGQFARAVATIDSTTVALTGTPIVSSAPPVRLVNGKAPSVARAAFQARLSRIDSTGALGQAFVSARARMRLLVDTPSVERSAEFNGDPARIARDLSREIGELERGRNPYVGQAGDQWRVFRGGNGALIPFRIVVPPAAATSRGAVPVIIALHGAGGDENMFIEAYGQGITVSLAMGAGAIVVSPATTAFSQSPASVDSLLAVLRSEYRVDNSRLYLVGHSMGAGAAAQMVQQHPMVFAAAACLAGGAAVTATNAPPMLFIGAELDPLIAPRVVKAAAAASPTATYEELSHVGHTLMVGLGIRRALPWLLEHRR